MSELWHLISAHLHQRIRQVHISSLHPDKLVYVPNEHDCFSNKSFVCLHRREGIKRRWASGIWGAFIPPVISTFLWKLLRHALPVDTRIQSRGIYLASRYRCCSEQSEESLAHLFIHSEVVRQVWSYFANIFKLPSGYSSILQALNILMAGTPGTSQYGIARIFCSAYIFREIWVARCNATYDEDQMSAQIICSKVLNRIRTLSLVVNPKRGSTALQISIIEQLGIRKQPTRIKRGIWCKWDRLSPGWFKLNVDGSVKGGFTTGG